MGDANSWGGQSGIAVQLRLSTQRGRVVQNLMEAVNSLEPAHGSQRLVHPTLVENPRCATHQLMQLTLSPRDCKEVPRSTGSDRRKEKGFATTTDSLDWYNSCESDQCIYGQGVQHGLDSLEEWEDSMPRKYV